MQLTQADYPHIPQWTNLVKDMEANSLYPKNIIVGPNIKHHSNVAVLEGLLTKNGNILLPNTIITVGSDWLEHCVTDAIQNLLIACNNSANVSTFQIDMYVSTPLDAYHIDDPASVKLENPLYMYILF